MGICGRLLSFIYRREEAPVDKRGKACLANGELYTIRYSPHLRVKDVCIDIAKQLNIAPDFFTLMTTDCEHCLRTNRQIKQQCDKQKDHYLNPKRVLHAEEIASKVFFFRLAFKAVAGPDLKVVNAGAYEYFVMQCRWDYINGRINNLARKDHLTLLVLESIIRAHEQGISSKDVLDNPKHFSLAHLFVDNEYSCREIKSHLKKQLSQFKTAQNNIDKSKNSFLYVLEGVTDFGVTKIVVKKFYYQSASEDKIYPVKWEILISPNGLKKRRTYKDERNVDSDDTTGSNRVDEMISDYKDIEYLEIKQSESDEIIHISTHKGFLEAFSVGKSEIKKESLITLIEGFYHLFVNQYKTLTKYEPGLELPLSSARQTRKLHIHGPIERKKVEVLLKAVETENGDRSGVHMIRRSRKEFDDYVLSFIHGNEIKHFEIVHANKKYGIKNGPTFDNMIQLLEFYKTEQTRFPTILTKYCPIPKEEIMDFDDEVCERAVPWLARHLSKDVEKVAILLEVDSVEIEAIKQGEPQPERRNIKILNSWRNAEMKFGKKPTWEKVRLCLEDETVGRCDVIRALLNEDELDGRVLVWLAPRIATCFRNYARVLGVPEYEIDMSSQNFEGVERSCMDVLQRWRRRTRYPKVEDLIQTLEHDVINRPDLAEEMREKICNHEVKIRRHQMKDHLDQNLQKHLDLAFGKIRDMGADLREKTFQLNQHSEKLALLAAEQARNMTGNGTLMWAIDNFEIRFRQTVNGIEPILQSEPALTGQYGYKFRSLVHLNGDAKAKGSCISVYIQLLKGEYDSLLRWPFQQEVKFTLIDQQNDLDERRNIVKVLAPAGNNEGVVNFQRPIKSCNTGRGYAKFVPHDVIRTRRYIRDDMMYLKIEVEPTVTVG